MRFKQFLEQRQAELAEESINWILVEVPESLLALTLTLESYWQESGYKDWMYRIDPARPEMSQMRHVHIAREKHKNAKGMQASWNDNGSRHDNKSFNDDVGRQKAVRDIARNALGIGSNVVLESDQSMTLPVLQDSVKLTSDGGAELTIGFA